MKLALIGILLAQPGVLLAQSSSTAFRVFGGVQLIDTTESRSPRVFYIVENAEGVPWQIEGGVRVARRLRLGGELTLWGRTESHRSSPDALRQERQEEKVAQVTVRYVVLSAPGVDLAALGGVGVLFDDYERKVTTSCVPPPPGPACDFIYPQRDRHAVFSGGAEISVRLLPHVGFAAAARLAIVTRRDRRNNVFEDVRRSRVLWVGFGPRVMW